MQHWRSRRYGSCYVDEAAIWDWSGVGFSCTPFKHQDGECIELD